jgi:hyperosmotically inducible protein
MKTKINSLLLSLATIALLSAAPGCKSKPKDADIKKSVETVLQGNSQTAGLSVEVDKGVVTLNGQVTDPAAQSAASAAASTVKGVKSVTNNVTVAAAPAPVEITPDDPLTQGVRDATKDFPGVTATVNDGAITVTGDIKSADWKRLKAALDGLKPKKVDAKGLNVTN